MKIRQNLHIHSHNSCDSACASLADIVSDMKQLGVEEFVLTDHLHTRFNLPDIAAARREFLALGPVPGFHFGIEVTCATKWECEKIRKRDYASCYTTTVNGFRFQTMTPIDGIMFDGPPGGELTVDLNEDEIREYGIELVDGGVHKPNYTPLEEKPMIEDYFRQSIFLIEHPLVHVLAHPWDGLQFWSCNWIGLNRDRSKYDYQSLLHVPDSMNNEIATALKQYGKAAEINACWLKSYDEAYNRRWWEIMADWREQGVKFTFGNDQHSAHPNLDQWEGMERKLDEYGFTEADFVLPFRVKNA